MDKVLIIGGCGYIGTRLFKHLTSIGYEVASWDLEWFGKHGAYENTQRDFSTLAPEYLWQFSAVVLLAAHSSVKMCEKNQNSCFNNNVRNFLSLMSKLKKGQKFIYASSSSIYGGLSVREMNEYTNEYRALNYYDLSKYEIDSYAKLSTDVEYYGLRFGTVNGFSLNFRDDVMLNAMYRTSIKENVVNISNPDIYRPILGLTDLCHAVSVIIKDGDFSKRGIYNLASFNSQVKDIGAKAAEILGVRLNTMEDRPNAYNFTISTQLFTDIFGYKFKETIDSILHEIMRGQALLNFTNRNTPQKYEP